MIQKQKNNMRITQRTDYLAIAASGRKWITPSLIIQARKATDTPEQPLARAGFTVSKKVGNAVMRNRAKRRIKEAVNSLLAENGLPGWDYVFIGRQTAITYPFEKMLSDIKWGLAKLASGADLKQKKSNQR